MAVLRVPGRASGTSTYIISALLVTAAFICTGVTASAVNFDNLIEDAVESLNTRQPHLHARRRLMGSGNTGSLSNLKRLDTQHSRLLQQAEQGDSFDGETRGLKVEFLYAIDPSRTKAEKDYVTEKLMPATAAVLARSIKVRNPSGPLMLAGMLDYYDEPIPGPDEGYDADIVLKVDSLAVDDPYCEDTLASAAYDILEEGTDRPIYGAVTLCQMNPRDFEGDLTTTVHEVLHALVFDPALFDSFPGYPNGSADVIAKTKEGKIVVKTPNVLKAVQDHFSCADVLGAELEDDGGSGSIGSHWDERLFEGELMDAIGASGTFHHYRHVLTDITLGLLQDSGWYDVKYASGGFNTYGYKAGCEFATGTFKQALASPDAERYLCAASEEYEFECTHDHSAEGYCQTADSWDGFYKTLPDNYSDVVDCMKLNGRRGTRCLQEKSELYPDCVAMSCSSEGTVLVAGNPCNPSTHVCPDDAYMCNDPGVLTCVGELNDCSGRGDCYKGACFCHAGWGGKDCSVPVCLANEGCADGSACPASGFCGVEECGTWSSGPLDRGTPCYGGLGSAALIGDESSDDNILAESPGGEGNGASISYSSGSVQLPAAMMWTAAVAVLAIA